jgi:hypothetical protein
MAQGAMSEAAHQKMRRLRALKYRLLFIFLALPGLLVAAIVFDWIWSLNLSGRMTHEYVLAIYGGLIAVFVLIFCIVGYLIRKRMRREEQDALKGPAPAEMSPRPTTKPITTKLKDGRSRH